MRLRSSGILNMFCTALKNFSIYLRKSYAFGRDLNVRHNAEGRNSYLGNCRGSLNYHCGRSARFFDLVLSRLGKAMR